MTYTSNPTADLLSAIIQRAIDDIKGIKADSRRKAEPDNAMAFILSETCEGYCLFLDLNYEALQERASEYYKQLLTKETPDHRLKKTVKRRVKTNRNIKPCHSPGKRAGSTYRYI